MRRLAALLAAGSLVLALGAAPASANNDPHRAFFPSGPLDLVGFCAFPVHVDFPVNREYATTTVAEDGSTVIHITGSVVDRVTNMNTGRSMTFNIGGPGTFVFPAEGSTTFRGHLFGRSMLYAPNLTELGLPSNIVALAGPVVVTQDVTDPTFAFLTVSGHYRVITDVCAALV